MKLSKAFDESYPLRFARPRTMQKQLCVVSVMCFASAVEWALSVIDIFCFSVTHAWGVNLSSRVLESAPYDKHLLDPSQAPIR